MIQDDIRDQSSSLEEELSDLLFELSNSDRLRILTLLAGENFKLSSLAGKTHETVQETSRHLERLTRSGLIVRNAEGEYYASQTGKVCLSQLESFEFVVRNQDYIADHELSVLPEKFVHRLGELTETAFAKNVTDVLRHTEDVLRGAKKYVMLMADQPLIPAYAFGAASPNQNVVWKSIIPRSAIPPQSDEGPVPPENFQARFLDNPKVGIALNEEIAGVTFPDLKGRLDMSAGFSGSGRAFHRWCLELFEYYWNMAGESGPANQFSF